VQPANLTKEEYEGDMGKKMIWETSMKTYLKRMDLLESNTRGIYAIVWGQCSPMMQSKLESLDDFGTKSNTCDCVWLLKEIQGITHRFEGMHNVFISLDDAWSGYYGHRQTAGQTLHEYLKEFQSLVQVLEHYGAALGAEGPYQDSVKEQVMADAPDGGFSTEEYRKRAVMAAKKKSVAIAFLKRADRKQYGGLWSELENIYTRGQDHYPSDLTGAYNLLLNYKAPPAPSHGRRDPPVHTADDVSSVTGVTFLQRAAPIAGRDGIVHANITCYHCDSLGHYASECPDAKGVEDGVQMLQLGPTATISTAESSYQSAFTFLHLAEPSSDFILHQADSCYDLIPDTWILLDSQSTVSVFKNRSLLSNIRASCRTLRVHTNGGTQLSTQLGTVTNFGDVWFNTDSLANILSMAAVRKVCRITMDTSVAAAMHVHRKDGTIMTFSEYESGLYYYDTCAHSTAANQSNPTNAYLFLNTVAGNMAHYTQREIQGADTARELYRKLGHPSEQEFVKILQNNLIRNCPVTSDDAKRALIIYGPDLATLKGKTVKTQNRGIPNYQPILIPAPIIAKYSNIRLFIDIFWVNGSPFFHTISQHVKFRTVAPIANRTKRTLLMEVKAVINLYETRGFNITRIEGDREFNCIVNDILPITLNVADADDHVHEVERSIRTIKERTRCTIQGLPFRRIPKLMMRAAVEGAHKTLNQFPVKNGASDVLSPLTIMTGQPNPNYHDLKIEFGAYVQVFEDNDPTNTVRTRTTGAIALTPTGNAQGGYYFLSLTTGRRLSRQQWDELPMPDGVIAAVEAMAERDHQPPHGHGAPIFEWSPGITIDDGDNAPIVIDEPEVENAHIAEDVIEIDNNHDNGAEPEEDQEMLEAVVTDEEEHADEEISTVNEEETAHESLEDTFDHGDDVVADPEEPRSDDEGTDKEDAAEQGTPRRSGDTISDQTGPVTTRTVLTIKWTTRKARRVTVTHSSYSMK
jgi:hypothetical protein